MAFHILIQRSTPSLFKRFCFIFPAFSSQKITVPSCQALQYPASWELPQDLQARIPVSNPLCRPMAFLWPFPPSNDRKKSPPPMIWNKTYCIRMVLEWKWLYLKVLSSSLRMFYKCFWRIFLLKMLGKTTFIFILCLLYLLVSHTHPGTTRSLGSSICFASRRPGIQTPSPTVVQFPQHPGRLANLTSTPRSTEHPCLPRYG